MGVRQPSRWGLALVLICSLVACGDGTGTSTVPTTPATASSTPPPLSAAVGDANAVPIYVDGGLSAPTHAIPNAIFTTIEVCAPGSSSNCAVIPHVLVDTGSVGLRLLASAINAANAPLLGALPQTSSAAGSVGSRSTSRPPISAGTAVRSRSSTATCAPSAASRRATAAPMPRPPPVTTATRLPCEPMGRRSYTPKGFRLQSALQRAAARRKRSATASHPGSPGGDSTTTSA